MIVFFEAVLMICMNFIIYFAFGSLISSRFKKTRLSATISVLLGFFLYYCVFDIPCLIIMLHWRPLSWLALCWGIMMPLIVLISAIINRKKWLICFKEAIAYIKAKPLLTIAAVIIVLAETAIILHAYEFTLDAAYYVANVTTSLETNTMNIYNPYTGDWQNHFEMRYLFATYPMEEAVMCYITGIHPLIWTKTIMAATSLILSNIIYYRIGRELFKGEKNEDLKTVLMIFFAGIVNFFYISTFTSSEFLLTRSYEGKTLVANIVLPMIIYLFLKIREDFKAKRYWWIMALVCLSSTILSNSSDMLVPAALGILSIPYAMRKKNAGIFLKYLLCVSPCLFMLLAYVLYVKGVFVFYTYPPLFGKH
ncbi:DUF6077 domain-containing protein [Lachnospiraceae bacterium C1.1]|nr:DUF6077 domain-containing protein [Lachnospiraceae bacterium C1.1]